MVFFPHTKLRAARAGLVLPRRPFIREKKRAIMVYAKLFGGEALGRQEFTMNYRIELMYVDPCNSYQLVREIPKTVITFSGAIGLL